MPNFTSDRLKEQTYKYECCYFMVWHKASESEIGMRERNTSTINMTIIRGDSKNKIF